MAAVTAEVTEEMEGLGAEFITRICLLQAVLANLPRLQRERVFMFLRRLVETACKVQ